MAINEVDSFIKILLTVDDLNEIALSLKLKSLSDDIKKSLQEALVDTVKLSCTVLYQKSAADRKKLELTYKSAKILRDQLSDVLFALRIIDGGEYENLYFKVLPAIERRSCNELQTYVKGQGRKKENWPMRLLIGRLAKIYRDATNKKPTLSKNLDNKPGGDFYNFVSKFIKLANIKYPSEYSLSAIIEDIIYIPKNK